MSSFFFGKKSAALGSYPNKVGITTFIETNIMFLFLHSLEALLWLVVFFASKFLWLPEKSKKCCYFFAGF